MNLNSFLIGLIYSISHKVPDLKLIISMPELIDIQIGLGEVYGE